MKPLYYSYLITLLLFIGVNYCFGQAQNQEVTPYTTLYPFEENGWYGLIDSVGRVVIEAQFSAIWPDDFFYGSDFSIEKLNREIAYTWDQRSKEYQDAIKYNKTELIKKRKRIIPEAPTSPSKLLFYLLNTMLFIF